MEKEFLKFNFIKIKKWKKKQNFCPNLLSRGENLSEFKFPETLRSHMGFIVAMTGIVLISFNGQNLELNPF